MKKLLPVLLLFSFGLVAADFWSKPSSEWSDKDLQKMMSNSPWAHTESVPMSGPQAPTVGGGRGPADDTAAPAPISAGGGGGRGGGRGGGGGGGGGDIPAGGGGGSINIVTRWQSARMVKEAAVRLRFGAKADSSDEAKQILAQEDPNYVIVVTGNLRPLLRGNADMIKQTLMEVTSLTVKGKPPVKPSDIQLGSDRRSVDIVMQFPRSAAFSLDDKEVEFATKLADVAVKYKFKLKDMAVNGKLEL
jgi:hypothetical protein